MRARLRGLLLLVIGGAIGAVLALGAVQHTGPAAVLFSSTCSVGLAGTALSITAEGPNAEQWCSDTEGTAAGNGATWYRYGENETLPGVLVCRQPYDGNTITVRDQGALMLYGSEACASIQNSATAFDAAAVTGNGGGSHGSGAGSVDRLSELALDGVCLLTVPDHNVAIYAAGEVARTYCEGLIDLEVGGLDDWRVAQGYSGTGHQPPLICERDFGDLMVVVYDTGSAYYGGLVCDFFSGS